MSKKTITKFPIFVIQAAAISLLCSACTALKRDAESSGPARYSPSKVTGKIRSQEIVESSGIAASKCQSDVFWTHNDSGGKAAIYAFNRSGEDLGTWRISNVENRDWEDIATWKDSSGRCFIYIGEIGDNKRIWPEYAVIRVEEPIIQTRNAADPEGRETLPGQTLRYVYPDGNEDAEALMVHPQSGDIFVITKNDSGPAAVYRIPGEFDVARNINAVKVARITLPAVPNGLVTGGDISPDGRRVILCDYRQAYEFELSALVSDFDEIWKQKPYAFEIGRRKTGEAVCYSVDGNEIFATSEGKNPSIVSVTRLK